MRQRELLLRVYSTTVDSEKESFPWISTWEVGRKVNFWLLFDQVVFTLGSSGSATLEVHLCRVGLPYQKLVLLAFLTGGFSCVFDSKQDLGLGNYQFVYQNLGAWPHIKHGNNTSVVNIFK